MTDENSKEISALPVSEDESEGNQENDEGIGQSGPLTKRGRGRPPGAKNKNTNFKELMQDEFRALAENKVPAVLNVLFDKAIDGDIQAIKMVMDRIVPAHKAVDGDKTLSGTPLIEIRIGNLEDSVQVGGEILSDVRYKEVEDASS